MWVWQNIVLLYEISAPKWGGGANNRFKFLASYRILGGISSDQNVKRPVSSDFSVLNIVLYIWYIGWNIISSKWNTSELSSGLLWYDILWNPYDILMTSLLAMLVDDLIYLQRIPYNVYFTWFHPRELICRVVLCRVMSCHVVLCHDSRCHEMLQVIVAESVSACVIRFSWDRTCFIIAIAITRTKRGIACPSVWHVDALACGAYFFLHVTRACPRRSTHWWAVGTRVLACKIAHMWTVGLHVIAGT